VILLEVSGKFLRDDCCLPLLTA
jgi:hypothetical protein